MPVEAAEEDRRQIAWGMHRSGFGKKVQQVIRVFPMDSIECQLGETLEIRVGGGGKGAEGGRGEVATAGEAVGPNCVIVQVEQLKAFTRDVFVHCGCDADAAKEAADVLLSADLRGVWSDADGTGSGVAEGRRRRQGQGRRLS